MSVVRQVTIMILITLAAPSAALGQSQTVYYYSSYNAGQAWAFSPANMTDGNESTETGDDVNGVVHELTAHTLESGSGGSGTITMVELRYKGRHDGEADDRASLKPVFSGTLDGDLHDPGTILTTSLEWIPWIDITTDTNAPGTWAWSDVTNLDVEAAQEGNDETWISKVQLRVTYSANSTPDAPSALGPSAYIDGGCRTDTTPTLEFTQSDADSGDTLAFQIQIDDTSDFSSAVVDYESASLSQGSASFTVGQAAGAGSYASGSEGQTLADASYYWRVRSYDGVIWGAWTTANGGAVAFEGFSDCPQTVGPPTAGACGGEDCNYQSIQAAIDAASAGDTITLFRRTDDANNNECYDEHITIDISLTLQGDSITPASAACIGPSTHGHIVLIRASDVTLENLHISGRINDGAGGENAFGAGGRASGHGVYAKGGDLDNVRVINCTVDYTFGDNVRYNGDQNHDGDGFIEIKQCYLHHSDTGRNIRIVRGGGSASDEHIVRNNLIHTGKGVTVTGECDYLTIERNIIKGWPYWGHLGGPFPETRDGSHGGGWRYYSNSQAGIWVTDPDPSNLTIQNNLTVAARVGIRVNTTGTIRNNTVINPFNASLYDYDSTVDANDIRDNTYGIMIASGFSGTIQNNIVAVTADNRANGDPGKASGTYYTPGISGYGIAFEGDSGSLSGANISNNNVWGFVDTDGSTPLNYGSGITQGASNLSVDPQFATDTTDESNGGSAPCSADDGGTRCYELYEDNFFLGTTRTAGSCHAEPWDNTAGGVAFVDLSDAGARDPDSDAISGLGDCSFAADASDSRAIDFGSGAVSDEPEKNGDAPNLGAFGGTDRASKTPTLKIMAIDVGDGGVKNGDNTAAEPGVVQARSAGITELNVYFNRGISAASNAFEVRNYCDSADLAAATFDFSEAAVAPYRVRMTWANGTFNNRPVRIHAFGDGVDRIVDLEDGEAFDGEISGLDSGPLPSGNDTAGGDAEFVVYALTGDVDGDRRVAASDLSDITALDGSTTAGLPEDIDGDGTVEGAASEDDYVAADAVDAGWWVDSTADTNTATTLRYALNNATSGEHIRFDMAAFDPCQSAVIDVDSTPLPTLSQDDVTIESVDSGVSIRDSDGDLGNGEHGLTISGDGNTIRGLQIKNFDSDNSTYGIHITGANNTIGGTFDAASANALGQGCLISANGRGVVIDGASATGNTVQGCLIGTDIAGTAADGNAVEGVYITNAATANTIGGRRDTGTFNVISANAGRGVHVKGAGTDSNIIKGNYIGTDAAAAVDLGNVSDGIKLDTSAYNTVGGVASGEDNVIAHNGSQGIELGNNASDYNTLRGNLIYDNSNEAIKLGGGSNEDIAIVVITAATDFAVTGTSSETDGTIVDVYTNTDSDDDCLDHAGSTTVSSGAWTLSGLDLTINDYVVAVQTDSSGNSSEVSSSALITLDTTVVRVDTASDVSDGITSSIAVLKANRGADGKISLREAIQAVAAGQNIGFDTGVFDPLSPATIDVDSMALPALDDDNVTIAASSSGVIIADSDADLGGGVDGLTITASGVTVQGLQVLSFPDAGIVISGAGADGNTIGGSYNAAADNQLGEGCLISDNGGDGIVISNADNNVVSGCLVGTDLSGTGNLGNGADGVYLTGGATSNTIHGTTAAQRCLIAYNGGYGVAADGASTDGNAWRGALAYDNTLAAVDLAADGSNDDIAPPTITTASAFEVRGTSTEADGTLIDLYTNSDGDSDLLTYEDSTTVTSGAWAFTCAGLTPGVYVVVMQTDASGNSSEVSAATLLATPTSITVNTTTDVSDGDTTDLTALVSDPGSDCKISLREALEAIANSESILFDTTVFPPGSPATIDVDGSALPALDDDNVIIDASTVGVIVRDSDGDLANGDHGLTISGDGNTVKGLQFDDFDAGSSTYAIYVTGANNTIGGDYDGGAANSLGDGCLITSNYDGIVIDGVFATGNAVRGCIIGMNRAGSGGDANAGTGLVISGGATSNTIGGTTAAQRCLISKNNAEGVWITGSGTTNNTVSGNYIGTDITGSSDQGNSLAGVLINGGAQSNTVGGTSAAARNVISGNDEEGVLITGSGSDSNLVRGNYIGLAADGTTDRGNNLSGVVISAGAQFNSIGGAIAGAGNVISGNNKRGLWITGSGTDNNIVAGNYIGTNAAGSAALKNDDEGVYIDAGAASATIGGDRDDSAGNLISGNNKEGIKIKDVGSDGHVIKGNYIGTDATGTAAIKNNKSGIKLEKAASCTIGSTTSGEENLIAFNDDRGIEVKKVEADFNTWRANIVHGNQKSNIRLTNDANGELDGPVVDSAEPTQVLGSGAGASATVDVLSNPTGNSDCEVYLGSTTADGGGNWSLTGLSLTGGHGVVAIQTLTDGTSSRISAPTVVDALVVDTTSDVVDGTTTSKSALEASPGADGKISLREALLAIGDGQAIIFDTSVFPPGSPATIDVDSDELPALDNNSVIISAAGAGVILDDPDNDLKANDDGLTVSGNNNVIKGLRIQNFDKNSGVVGILVTGSSNAIGGTGDGDANTITACGGAGIEVNGVNADFNSLRQNVSYDNGGLAIDLASNGNNGLTAPTIDTVSTTQVTGSGAAANATVDLFTNTAGDSDCLVYVETVEADGSGNWSVLELTLTTGEYVVAIQTNTSGDSSEVSTAVVVP